MKFTLSRTLQAAMVIAALSGGLAVANAATETAPTASPVTDAQAQQHFQTMSILRQKVFDTQQALDNEYSQAKPDQAKITSLTRQLGELNAQWYASRSAWHEQMMKAGYTRGIRGDGGDNRGYGMGYGMHSGSGCGGYGMRGW